MAGAPIDTPDDLPSGPLYVFGYGSLLWYPGFRYERVVRSRIHGFHRALRVWSYHHRGTVQRPGLVLGLDRGGSCLGCLFEVDATLKREVADYLWAREMVTSVYIPRLVPAPFAGGVRVAALAFVLDRRHTQYAGALSAGTAAGHVRGAAGVSGHNLEYVRETVNGLERLGIHDEGLRSVLRRLERADA